MFQNVVSVHFTKTEKEESSPVQRDWIRQRKWTKFAVQVDTFFNLKIFILFHNLLLLTVASFIHFNRWMFHTYLLGNRGPTTKESDLGELDNIAATESAKKTFRKVMWSTCQSKDATSKNTQNGNRCCCQKIQKRKTQS